MLLWKHSQSIEAMIDKSYSELIKFDTFEERFRYLKLDGVAFDRTFGSYRYLNQRFYSSKEWKRFRRDIIIRDNACDLGIDDGLHDIPDRIMIHHINPITQDDILNHRYDALMNSENAICVSHNTHEAIHYGDETILYIFAERKPNDTLLWKPIEKELPHDLCKRG